MAWLRIAAALAGLVVAVLLLRVLPPIVVLLAVIAVSWLVARRMRASVRRDVRTGTEVLGLRRETSDPFGLASFPLQVFSRSEDVSIDEVAWGTWRGMEVRAFGATALAPGTTPDGGGASSRTAIAGVLTNVAGDAPSVVIEPEVFATMFPRLPALGRVDLDDDALAASWTVWSDDAAFARSLLSEPMRAWLRSLGDAWAVEVSDRIALVYGRRPERADVVAVLELLGELVRLLPEDPSTPSRPAAGGGEERE
jgi:hypothetical protein